MADSSYETRKKIENSIRWFDDEIRVKNMLIRSYVEKPYLLFIVAGQSNAVGTGPNPGYEDASYCGYYWYWKSPETRSLRPLKDPVAYSNRGSAWPEFARKMFELTGRKVIILNVARGGAAVTNISTNTWYQDSGFTSPCRDNATREWVAMTQYLKDKGIKYELAGMLWIQGESECARVGTGALNVQKYIDGTIDAFNYFKTLTETPNLHIYMAQIGYTNTVLINQDLLKGYEIIRKTQNDLCNTTPNVFMASELPGTYFNAGYMQDTIHYNQRGYNSLGASFARYITNHQTFN